MGYLRTGFSAIAVTLFLSCSHVYAEQAYSPSLPIGSTNKVTWSLGDVVTNLVPGATAGGDLVLKDIIDYTREAEAARGYLVISAANKLVAQDYMDANDRFELYYDGRRTRDFCTAANAEATKVKADEHYAEIIKANGSFSVGICKASGAAKDGDCTNDLPGAVLPINVMKDDGLHIYSFSTCIGPEDRVTAVDLKDALQELKTKIQDDEIKAFLESRHVGTIERIATISVTAGNIIINYETDELIDHVTSVWTGAVGDKWADDKTVEAYNTEYGTAGIDATALSPFAPLLTDTGTLIASYTRRLAFIGTYVKLLRFAVATTLEENFPAEGIDFDAGTYNEDTNTGCVGPYVEPANGYVGYSVTKKDDEYTLVHKPAENGQRGDVRPTAALACQLGTKFENAGFLPVKSMTFDDNIAAGDLKLVNILLATAAPKNGPDVEVVLPFLGKAGQFHIASLIGDGKFNGMRFSRVSVVPSSDISVLGMIYASALFKIAPGDNPITKIIADGQIIGEAGFALSSGNAVTAPLSFKCLNQGDAHINVECVEEPPTCTIKVVLADVTTPTAFFDIQSVCPSDDSGLSAILYQGDMQITAQTVAFKETLVFSANAGAITITKTEDEYYGATSALREVVRSLQPTADVASTDYYSRFSGSLALVKSLYYLTAASYADSLVIKNAAENVNLGGIDANDGWVDLDGTYLTAATDFNHGFKVSQTARSSSANYSYLWEYKDTMTGATVDEHSRTFVRGMQTFSSSSKVMFEPIYCFGQTMDPYPTGTRPTGCDKAPPNFISALKVSYSEFGCNVTYQFRTAATAADTVGVSINLNFDYGHWKKMIVAANIQYSMQGVVTEADCNANPVLCHHYNLTKLAKQSKGLGELAIEAFVVPETTNFAILQNCLGSTEEGCTGNQYTNFVRDFTANTVVLTLLADDAAPADAEKEKTDRPTTADKELHVRYYASFVRPALQNRINNDGMNEFLELLRPNAFEFEASIPVGASGILKANIKQNEITFTMTSLLPLLTVRINAANAMLAYDILHAATTPLDFFPFVPRAPRGAEAPEGSRASDFEKVVYGVVEAVRMSSATKIALSSMSTERRTISTYFQHMNASEEITEKCDVPQKNIAVNFEVSETDVHPVTFKEPETAPAGDMLKAACARGYLAQTNIPAFDYDSVAGGLKELKDKMPDVFSFESPIVGGSLLIGDYHIYNEKFLNPMAATAGGGNLILKLSKEGHTVQISQDIAGTQQYAAVNSMAWDYVYVGLKFSTVFTTARLKLLKEGTLKQGLDSIARIALKVMPYMRHTGGVQEAIAFSFNSVTTDALSTSATKEFKVSVETDTLRVELCINNSCDDAKLPSQSQTLTNVILTINHMKNGYGTFGSSGEAVKTVLNLDMTEGTVALNRLPVRYTVVDETSVGKMGLLELEVSKNLVKIKTLATPNSQMEVIKTVANKFAFLAYDASNQTRRLRDAAPLRRLDEYNKEQFGTAFGNLYGFAYGFSNMFAMVPETHAGINISYICNFDKLGNSAVHTETDEINVDAAAKTFQWKITNRTLNLKGKADTSQITFELTVHTSKEGFKIPNDQSLVGNRDMAHLVPYIQGIEDGMIGTEALADVIQKLVESSPLTKLKDLAIYTNVDPPGEDAGPTRHIGGYLQFKDFYSETEADKDTYYTIVFTRGGIREVWAAQFSAALVYSVFGIQSYFRHNYAELVSFTDVDKYAALERRADHDAHSYAVSKDHALPAGGLVTITPGADGEPMNVNTQYGRFAMGPHGEYGSAPMVLSFNYTQETLTVKKQQYAEGATIVDDNPSFFRLISSRGLGYFNTSLSNKLAEQYMKTFGYENTTSDVITYRTTKQHTQIITNKNGARDQVTVEQEISALADGFFEFKTIFVSVTGAGVGKAQGSIVFAAALTTLTALFAGLLL